jgi:hypothetical protein
MKDSAMAARRPTSPLHHSGDRQYGGGLIAAFVVLLGISAVFWALSQRYDRLPPALQSTIIKNDFEQLSDYVVESVSCPNTLNLSADGRRSICDVTPEQSYVELKRPDGTVFVKAFKPKDLTIVGGRYGLRARCLTCKDCGDARYRIAVEAALVDASGNLTPDPLTGRVAPWRDLLGASGSSCLAP